jgi:hypothetical protein
MLRWLGTGNQYQTLHLDILWQLDFAEHFAHYRMLLADLGRTGR